MDKDRGFIAASEGQEEYILDEVFDTYEDAAARCKDGQVVHEIERVTAEEWWESFPGIAHLEDLWGENLVDNAVAPYDWPPGDVSDDFGDDLFEAMDQAARAVFLERVQKIRWFHVNKTIRSSAVKKAALEGGAE